ncbi:Wadjet anti-phage system protein JetD domain-containing protein [Alicyclobacillus herbarius]|uniref:Wadjet anti-phage system protein JetD domain-containing protein n=1 Tax=Alicyclobacillus herbarius TaxID=122960 RepID=UPI00047CFF6F|nr:Wadjet anti-phage system protein JetD domain-containing protein [Alicyclobacillus herbarius]
MTRSPWAERVVAELLHRYESSKAFALGQPTARRVQLRIEERFVPGYLSGLADPDLIHAFHADLVGLERTGVLELKWVKHEEGNLLERVYLQWSGIERAYAWLGRRPLRDELADIATELEAWRPRLRTSWLQQWLDDVLVHLREQGRFPTSLLPVEADRRQLLLAALAGWVDKGDEEMTLRLFSKRYLRDSKAFERQVQERFLAVVRRYWPPAQRLLEVGVGDAELLAELGISTSHDDVAFAGPLGLRLDGHEVDVSSFPYGLALGTESLRKFHVVSAPIQRVITIENKANYRYYVRQDRARDELVVYLAGFASPAVRRLLQAVRECFLTRRQPLPRLQHWGDLDYGGILILQHLRESVWPEAISWRMEPVWLDKLREYVAPFDARYRDKLARLLEDERYVAEWPLVRKLLEVGGTLEQEAFLV